ncbi:hypothetical protein BDN70DRAFT_897095 [Pholiota conissans]|uniref:Uncharacterized protein n=1 Tax=Pholiota conissans TaxID=109636 RepID=A0A9P6CR92_9AGAR|nr:hypothetical protein BDN70DRAFT_897095 [Pholiota conissans]
MLCPILKIYRGIKSLIGISRIFAELYTRCTIEGFTGDAVFNDLSNAFSVGEKVAVRRRSDRRRWVSGVVIRRYPVLLVHSAESRSNGFSVMFQEYYHGSANIKAMPIMHRPYDDMDWAASSHLAFYSFLDIVWALVYTADKSRGRLRPVWVPASYIRKSQSIGIHGVETEYHDVQILAGENMGMIEQSPEVISYCDNIPHLFRLRIRGKRREQWNWNLRSVQKRRVVGRTSPEGHTLLRIYTGGDLIVAISNIDRNLLRETEMRMVAAMLSFNATYHLNRSATTFLSSLLHPKIVFPILEDEQKKLSFVSTPPSRMDPPRRAASGMGHCENHETTTRMR